MSTQSPSFLYRLGRSSAAHPWRVLGAWVLVLATVSTLSWAFGAPMRDDWDVPGARAQQGIDTLREHGVGGYASARVIVHDGSGEPLATAEVGRLTDRLLDLEHVASVSPPRLSEDGDTAILTVEYDQPVTHPDLMANTEPLEGAIAPTIDTGLQVELGGDLPDTAGEPIGGTGEIVGVVFALLILVIALGSAVGAGLPIGIAIAGLAGGSAGIGLLAATMAVSPSAPMVASMVGLGVGIDYALLLVTRHVENLRLGLSPIEAAARAVATSGRSVVLAAVTVLVSLMGLRLAGLTTYDAFGLATAIAVVFVATAALTLVPALCRLGGRKLLPRRVRRGRPERTTQPLTGRWAARVGRTPLPWALASLGVLLVLAAPVLDMHTWPSDASNQPADNTTRQAYDIVAEEYGPGTNGPVTVVVPTADGVTDEVVSTLASDDRIAAVAPAVVTPDGELAIVTAEPTFGPTDQRTSALVSDLRQALPDGAEVTGWTPFFSDISEMLQQRLWVVIAFVVGVSVLLLGVMFRSVLVPLKAAAMNLLSISAAYGVLVAVFQWGWGSDLLGVDRSMPLSSWMPILMFAILFGLSMDYEVFLLSRIREDYLRTGDPRGSVVRGLSATGRVITSAAAIMMVVFLGFASEGDVVVKQLGLGMAVAILLDATLVRMVLVPATMSLLGHWNWWLPAWLDRLLPTVRVEAELEEEPADERELVGV
ncbi:MMPL family transporter [Nocardioides KLBMP 9356]|uniref:MMPL family transporter n=1 Tax=Nocardioides potassii TaxID=2911371 RepID=A0ABS9H5A2_9ACTN|nr:MMPL family transporter [Nocardioides potassii]MCF6376440.1 MMPL family transporter [Nocardioides potassii]